MRVGRAEATATRLCTFSCSKRLPCLPACLPASPLQVYDALPPESRTAHAMLILPDRPAEVHAADGLGAAAAAGWEGSGQLETSICSCEGVAAAHQRLPAFAPRSRLLAPRALFQPTVCRARRVWCTWRPLVTMATRGAPTWACRWCSRWAGRPGCTGQPSLGGCLGPSSQLLGSTNNTTQRQPHRKAPVCTQMPQTPPASAKLPLTPHPPLRALPLPPLQGIATLALESPYYGQRKPHYQQGEAEARGWAGGRAGGGAEASTRLLLPLMRLSLMLPAGPWSAGSCCLPHPLVTTWHPRCSPHPCTPTHPPAPTLAGAKLLHVSDLLLLGRATIEESLLLLHWLGHAGHERLGERPGRGAGCSSQGGLLGWSGACTPAVHRAIAAPPSEPAALAQAQALPQPPTHPVSAPLASSPHWQACAA